MQLDKLQKLCHNVRKVLSVGVSMFEIAITVFAFIFFIASVLLFIKSGYLKKLLVKLGIKRESAKRNWAHFSWNSCIEKLELEADVVFFGDSITRGGDFHKYFRNYKIVNFGSTGDTLSGMMNRVSMIEAVSPKMVFFLGGINSLTDFNIENTFENYKKLIWSIKSAAPEAKIFIHSILPISKKKEKEVCTNKTVEIFNKKIHQFADENGITFIDLHKHYVFDGKMNPELTKDGIHLRPEAYSYWYEELVEHLGPQTVLAE